jgi:FtsZ-binding cell division protein ZapB
MMWYPGKAAFRAGQVSNTQWDDANIGLFSTAFGQDVRALGDHSFAQGLNAVAASVASIAMGQDVVATGANSVVLGYKAISSTGGGTPRTGTFVFGDRSVSSTGSALTASLTNSAHWRVANGFFIYTSSTLGSGVQVTAGSGSWSSLSDRDAKENFAPVDTREILRGVVEMPITTWNYKTQDPSIRHIGAMAQDFHSAFGIGEDDKHISTIDPDGVALAAIQGLHEELKDRDAKIDAQERQLEAQDEKLSKIEAQLREQQKVITEMTRTVRSGRAPERSRARGDAAR